MEPVQLGISVVGAVLLTRSVTGVLHAYEDFICFRLDLKNAGEMYWMSGRVSLP